MDAGVYYVIVFIPGTTVSFIVPCKKGGYLIGLGQTVSHFDWDTKEIKTLATVDEGKNTRFNDGKCDASGRLWCGKILYCFSFCFCTCTDPEGFGTGGPDPP